MLKDEYVDKERINGQIPRYREGILNCTSL